MIRKDYIDRGKFRFDPKLVIGEDTCFWITLLLHEDLLGIDIPLTTVYSNDDSAAYNINKQITGMKTILRFVLNNPELSKYDFETAILARHYVNFVSKLNDSDLLSTERLVLEDTAYNNYELKAIINSKSWRVTKPLRWASLFFKSLKTNGIKITIKKVIFRIKNKLRRY